MTTGQVADPSNRLTHLVITEDCAAQAHFLALGPVHVDAQAQGANNGSSWEDAYTTLQDALSVAMPGMEIKVARGTYYPDRGAGLTLGDQVASFSLRNGVTLKGGYAGAINPDVRDWQVYETILSGDLGRPNQSSDNANCVVVSIDNDETAVLEGFTISGGYGGHVQSSEAGRGAGMYVERGSPTIIHCTFRGNYAQKEGGGISNTDNANPRISHCLFVDNTADHGGAICSIESKDFTLANCVFNGNRALKGEGGAIFGQVSAANCLFYQNSAPVRGGAISGWAMFLTSCTFHGNTGGKGGAVSGESSILINSICWGNSPDQLAYIGKDVFDVRNSCIQNSWPGSGNIRTNPRFVDVDKADYHLKPESPCINKGNHVKLLSDALDLDGDQDTKEFVPLDLDGNPRVVGGQLDMGAYEFYPVSGGGGR